MSIPDRFFKAQAVPQLKPAPSKDDVLEWIERYTALPVNPWWQKMLEQSFQQTDLAPYYRHLDRAVQELAWRARVPYPLLTSRPRLNRRERLQLFLLVRLRSLLSRSPLRRRPPTS